MAAFPTEEERRGFLRPLAASPKLGMGCPCWWSMCPDVLVLLGLRLPSSRKGLEAKAVVWSQTQSWLLGQRGPQQPFCTFQYLLSVRITFTLALTLPLVQR